MRIDLSGRTALVAGSTQGIGKSTALSMARSGASLILLGRNTEKLQAVMSELREISGDGKQHHTLQADFSIRGSLQDCLANAKNVLGEVDILVNNTGGPPGGDLLSAEAEDFENAFYMHLVCNQLLAKACVPGMMARKHGKIINVISTSVKQPLPNLGVSNTIRGAVANWAKTLANELGPHGICVNNVLPGATHTGRLESIAENKAAKTGKSREEVLDDMARAVPLRRVAQPDELAAAICFLASDQANYINGINLPVDGGRTSCL